MARISKEKPEKSTLAYPPNMAKASHKIQSSRNQSSWHLILLIPGWRFASRYRTLGNLVSHGFLC